MLKKKIGELLRESGVVELEDVKQALGGQRSWGAGQRLGQLLVGLGKVTPEHVARALAEQSGLPYVEIGDIPASVSALVPVDFQDEHKVVPFRVESDGKSERLWVAVADPFNVEIIDELRFQLARHVRVCVASTAEIESVVKALRGETSARIDPLELEEDGEDLVLDTGHESMVPDGWFGSPGPAHPLPPPFPALEPSPPGFQSSPPVLKGSQPVPRASPPFPHPSPPAHQPVRSVVHPSPPVLQASPPVQRTSPPVQRASPPVQRASPPVLQAARSVVHPSPPVLQASAPAPQPSLPYLQPVPSLGPSVFSGTSAGTAAIAADLDELLGIHPDTPGVAEMQGEIPSSGTTSGATWSEDDDLRILQSLERLAMGEEPAQIVASLIQLLLRKGVISSTELLAELRQK
jgi:hypothetical protein